MIANEVSRVDKLVADQKTRGGVDGQVPRGHLGQTAVAISQHCVMRPLVQNCV
jgi:hypothetical protein